MKLLKGKRLESVASSGIQPWLFFAKVYFPLYGSASILASRQGRGECGTLGVCYSPSSHVLAGIEDRSVPFMAGGLAPR